MKVYLIKEDDFRQLLAYIDRDPKYGRSGGSSQVLSEQEKKVYEEAHGFYNYQVRGWIEAMKRE